MRRLIAAVCITLSLLAACAPAAATPEPRTTRPVHHQTCTTPTWPYGVIEVQRWWNCGHDPNIDRAGARRVKAWLDAVVAARVAAYLAAIDAARATTCTGPGDCPALVVRAFTVMGIPWRAGEAIRVMMCESGGNPNARNGSSSASGLFQQLGRYWPGRAATYGMAGRSVFDPWANAVVSAGMVRDTGGWSHWSCRP